MACGNWPFGGKKKEMSGRADFSCQSIQLITKSREGEIAREKKSIGYVKVHWIKLLLRNESRECIHCGLSTQREGLRSVE